MDAHLEVRDRGLARTGDVRDRCFKRNNRHKNLVRQAIAMDGGAFVHSIIDGHRVLRDHGGGLYKRGEWVEFMHQECRVRTRNAEGIHYWVHSLLRQTPQAQSEGRGGQRFSFSLEWMVRLSDVGTPASSMSVEDVLRINFASSQSSPVPCCRLTR